MVVDPAPISDRGDIGPRAPGALRSRRQRRARRKFTPRHHAGYSPRAARRRFIRPPPTQRASSSRARVFDRTERQQEFHYLLVKTVVQLYGFTAISRERAAISHNTLGRKWMTIVVRCSTWWGWDHWAFKASTVSGVHDVASKYAQTVPDVPARVGCTSFWDEAYPETRVYISHMPRRVYDQLTALHARARAAATSSPRPRSGRVQRSVAIDPRRGRLHAGFAQRATARPGCLPMSGRSLVVGRPTRGKKRRAGLERCRAHRARTGARQFVRRTCPPLRKGGLVSFGALARPSPNVRPTGRARQYLTGR